MSYDLMNRTTIVCVSVGNAFGPEYVVKLRNMTQRNTKVWPNRFICICDKENAHRIRELDRTIQVYVIASAQFPKWWGKLKIFDPVFQAGFNDILLFDLDTIITGDIDFMMNRKEHFIILENFLQPPVRNPNIVDPCKYGSAVMFVKEGFGHNLYNKYVYGYKDAWRDYERDGDQKFIEHWLRDNNITPTLWQDYGKPIIMDGDNLFRSAKYPNKLNYVPQNTRVICYHGSPRPHEDMENPIVKEHWK